MRRPTTKEVIGSSFMEVLSTKPYAMITVKEICDAADVSKVTFYHHFTGKDDLYGWLARNAGAARYQQLGNDYTWTDFLRQTIEDNVANQSRTSNAMPKLSDLTSLKALLLESNELLLTEYIVDHEGEQALTPELRIIMRTYLSGCLDMLVEHLQGKIDSTPDKLAQLLTLAVPQALAAHMPL